MPTRVRKIIGSFAILAFLAGWIWAATAIGAVLPQHWAAWVIFYPIAGTAWGLPLIPLLSWMNRER